MDISLDDEWIPIELLLCYPFFWRPAKICQFPQGIALEKEQMISDGPPITDVEKERSLLSVELNWKTVLSNLKCQTRLQATDKKMIKFNETDDLSTSEPTTTTHFNILTRKYTQSRGIRLDFKEEDFMNPMELAKIVRDKYVHFKDMPEEFKRVLGWATDEGFVDENKFANYWSSNFPSLLPYLWLKYHPVGRKEGSTLNKYYPELEDNQEIHLDPVKLPINLDGLCLFLKMALQLDLERGRVTERFASGQTLLEFRTLEAIAIQRILDGKLILKVQLSNENVQCSWYNMYCTGNNPLEEVKFVGGNECTNMVLIIGNMLSHVQNILLDELKICNRDRLIIFTTESGATAKDFLEEKGEAERLSIVEKPVQWQELCQSVQISVIETGKVVIGKEVVSLNSLLPNSEEDRASILSYLNGNLLNQLLKTRTAPELFRALTITTITNNYTNRKLYIKIKIDKAGIENASHSELFVLFMINREEVEKLFPKINTAFSAANWPELNYPVEHYYENLYLMEDLISYDFEKICSKISDKHKINVHFLRFVHGDVFEWAGTHGITTSFLQESYSEYLNGSAMLEENEFLNSIRNFFRSGKTVAIVGAPGNGKSSFLLSQAKKSSKQFASRLTFFHTMSKLVDEVPSEYIKFKEEVFRERIVEIISKIIGTTSFERKLLNYYLHYNEHCIGDENFLKFECFLDALDEVKHQEWEKAVKILKVIQGLSSVDVCLTMRASVLEDFKKHFKNPLIYELEPFTAHEQLQYIVACWKGKIDKNLIDARSENLLEFARECLNAHLQVNEQEDDACWLCDSERHLIDMESENWRKCARKCPKAHLPENEQEIADTPLVCTLIAEVYESQALSGNYEVPSKCNSMCSLYDLMWERKFEIWIEKHGALINSGNGKYNSVVATLRTDMQNWYSYLAIKLLFSEEIANKFKSCLFSSKQSWDDMLSVVLEQGVVTGLNPVTFLHQTFAEDAVSKFVVAVLKGEFFSIPPDSVDFDQFVCKVLETVHDCYINESRFKYPNLCHFVNARARHHGKDLPLELLSASRIQPSSWDRDGANHSSCFYAAYKLSLDHLVLLLLRLPKYLIDFFVFSLKYQCFEFCKHVMENPIDLKLIFDPESWTKYFSLHMQNNFCTNHWFFQVACVSFSPKLSKMQTQTNSYLEKLMNAIVENAKFLLERIDIDAKTPLLCILNTYIALPGNLLLAKYLVTQLRVNVNAVDQYKNTVLHVSENPFKVQVTNRLFNIYLTCPYAFHVSMEDIEHYVQCWKLFFENGYTRGINAVNAKGDTPLLTVIKNLSDNATHSLQFFKENKADFTVKNFLSETVLDIAIRVENGELFKSLIDYGADIDTFRREGDGFLFDCLSKFRENAVESYIDKFGADFGVLNRRGQTLAHMIIETRSAEFIKKVFQKRVNLISCMDSNGENALYLAACKTPELLKMCVEEHGLDVVSFKNIHGKTLLRQAISVKDRLQSPEKMSDKEKYIDTLVELGVDLHAVDDSGNTIVHLAAIENLHSEMLLKNSYGRFFSRHVQQFRWIIETMVLLRLIRDHDVDIYARNTNGQCALHLAVQANNINIVAMLVEMLEIELDAKDGYGKTAADYLNDKSLPEIRHILFGTFPAELQRRMEADFNYFLSAKTDYDKKLIQAQWRKGRKCKVKAEPEVPDEDWSGLV